ncbi:class I adenylate-forming enzyme family protein [Nocardia sp. NPDC051321]|uniref:class I adenylate-forming enzyme family protein n=1 Tax=Nocardia sp. NPDC051321 TaxID=3364323 RepID=UPI0037B72F80
MKSSAVTEILDEAAAQCPDRTALRDHHTVWNYSTFRSMTLRCACWLRDAGVRPGDHVVVHAPQSIRSLALLFGTLRLGAVFVPLPAVGAFQREPIRAELAPAVEVSDGAEVADTVDLDRLWPAIESSPDDLLDYHPEPHDPAVLMYTSGSTSVPKAVVCPHSAILFVVNAIAERLTYRFDDVVVSAVPLSFDYGLYQVLLTTLSRAELVLAAETKLSLFATLVEHKATVVPVIPSVAEGLCALARRTADRPPVRLFTTTGAPMHAPTLARLRTTFPLAQVSLMFGLTECKRVSVLEPDGDLTRTGSVGRPLTGTEVVIIDPTGRPRAPGEIGEIVVRGPHVMSGYWRAPEITARRFRRTRQGDTELHTGDYGYLDSDGYLYFTGRLDDLFKLRGTRVSGTEITAAALDVPAVREAAVVPDRDGPDATIFITGELTGAQFLRDIAQRLGSAKTPRHCRKLDQMPRTSNGKVDFTRLRDLVDGPRP